MSAAERPAQRREGRLARAPGQQQAAALGRRRQHLEGHLADRRKRAEAAGQELAEVVAGDVLDHAPAGLDQLAAAGHRLHAEQMVARRAGLDPPRPGEVARERAADRALARRPAEHGAVVGRLEGELLLVLGEQHLDRGKRRAGARRHHELRGLVERDPGEAIEAQHASGCDRPPERALAARAQDLERHLLGRRAGNQVLELVRRGRAQILGHGRSLKPRPSSPAAIASAQRSHDRPAPETSISRPPPVNRPHPRARARRQPITGLDRQPRRSELSSVSAWRAASGRRADQGCTVEGCPRRIDVSRAPR